MAISLRFINGRTRSVLLVGKWALKFPLLTNWKGFLKGLQGNMFEYEHAHISSVYLSPVVFYIPGGWLNVMPRCPLVSGLDDPNLIRYFETLVDECPNDEFPAYQVLDIIETAEYGNYGFYQGRVVAIDYGHGKNAGLNRFIIEEDRKRRQKHNDKIETLGT